MRRYGFHVFTVLLTLAAMETLAALSFAFLLTGKRLWWRDLDALGALPSAEDLAAWRASGHDPELGWLRRPDTQEVVNDPQGPWGSAIDERGARLEPFAGPSGVVSAYGDSFTFGHEVDDDDTWPHYLSELTGTRVDNWGQTAWGTDQAVLRLRHNLPAHRTDVVVLVIQSENIARLLNCYRPFLTGEAVMKFAFKPMLVRDGEAWRWLPNPFARAETLEDYARAIAIAKQGDYWYAENQRRPRPRFPYLPHLPAALAHVVRNPERANLYENGEAVARLDHILDEFAALADVHAFVPVVVFVPEPRELRRFARRGGYGYRSYVERLRTRTAGGALIVVDLLEHAFDAERFNRRPFKDHPSPYGNRVISTVVYDTIVPILWNLSEARRSVGLAKKTIQPSCVRMKMEHCGAQLAENVVAFSVRKASAFEAADERDGSLTFLPQLTEEHGRRPRKRPSDLASRDLQGRIPFCFRARAIPFANALISRSQ